MDVPYNQIICEVLSNHRNFIETGNMQISGKDILETKSTKNLQKLKKLTKHQKKICDTLIDIEACFSQ